MMMMSERPERDVRVVYGWECVTCGARETKLACDMYDEMDAEKDAASHDCDMYWECSDE